ncbi:putative GNAT family N-acetyltransferase [Cristinia sonorae]|uniref:GNAT family N-acetyltransferase n=1 Tax=Cristinia sonorae TaxID=1940300 RepID=A0A8K0UQC9_9AGAR|nr:putative GNAT family N-acetyltransferase [Cristinia sonorae]
MDTPFNHRTSARTPELPAGYRFRPIAPPLADYMNLRRICNLTPISATQGTNAIAEPTEVVVAMGRIIGDGGWYFHISDMAVSPEHQKKGLGGAVLGALMQRLEDVVEPGYIVCLFADPPGRHLYAKWGFRESDPASVGMMQWVGGKGEKKGEGWWPPKKADM